LRRLGNNDTDVVLDHQIDELLAIDQNDFLFDSSDIVLRILGKARRCDHHALPRTATF